MLIKVGFRTTYARDKKQKNEAINNYPFLYVTELQIEQDLEVYGD